MSQRNERSTQPEFDGTTQWLIHHAARRTPPCLSARLEEEWLADLESRASAASRLRFAVGCCWATIIIVSDHLRSRTVAPNPALATKGFITLADRNFGYFSLHSGTLFLILGLQAAVFCGLIATLSHARGLVTPTNPENGQLNTSPREIEVRVLLSEE